MVQKITIYCKSKMLFFAARYPVVWTLIGRWINDGLNSGACHQSTESQLKRR